MCIQSIIIITGISSSSSYFIYLLKMPSKPELMHKLFKAPEMQEKIHQVHILPSKHWGGSTAWQSFLSAMLEAWE